MRLQIILTDSTGKIGKISLIQLWTKITPFDLIVNRICPGLRLSMQTTDPANGFSRKKNG